MIAEIERFIEIADQYVEEVGHSRHFAEVVDRKRAAGLDPGTWQTSLEESQSDLLGCRDNLIAGGMSLAKTLAAHGHDPVGVLAITNGAEAKTPDIVLQTWPGEKIKLQRIILGVGTTALLDDLPMVGQRQTPKGDTPPNKCCGKQKTRSWTQPEVDTAVADEIKTYADTIQAAQNGRKGARNAVKRQLGRNAIAGRLVITPKMVGKAPAWRQLAGEFGMERQDRAAMSRPTKIGQAIAEEAAAEAAGDTTEDDLIRRETLAAINERMANATGDRREALEKLADSLMRGATSDDTVRKTLKLLDEQQQDDVARKVLRTL